MDETTWPSARPRGPPTWSPSSWAPCQASWGCWHWRRGHKPGAEREDGISAQPGHTGARKCFIILIYVSRKRKTNSLLRWQNWRWRACTARTTWSQPADASPPPPSRAPPQTQSPPTPPPLPHGTWGRWWQASPAQTPTIPSGGRQRQHATIICCRKHITLIILWNILRSQDCLLAAPTKPSSSPYSFGCLTAFLVLDHFPGNQQGNRGPQSKNSLSMSRGRYMDQGHTWKLRKWWMIMSFKKLLSLLISSLPLPSSFHHHNHYYHHGCCYWHHQDYCVIRPRCLWHACWASVIITMIIIPITMIIVISFVVMIISIIITIRSPSWLQDNNRVPLARL